MSERDEFEAWADAHSIYGGDKYVAWLAWQAARAPQAVPALTDHDVQSLQMIAGWLNLDGNRDAAAFLRGLAEKFAAPQPSQEPRRYQD